jgi:hypothetical protein
LLDPKEKILTWFLSSISFSSSLCLAELFWGKGEGAEERVWKILQSRFKTNLKFANILVLLLLI